jgi:hypothetical protein
MLTQKSRTDTIMRTKIDVPMTEDEFLNPTTPKTVQDHFDTFHAELRELSLVTKCVLVFTALAVIPAISVVGFIVISILALHH